MIRKPRSTAAGNVSYYENSRDEMEARAQIFVDDKEIIECIPLLTSDAEKAWHVVYNVTADNQMLGDWTLTAGEYVHVLAVIDAWGKGMDVDADNLAAIAPSERQA